MSYGGGFAVTRIVPYSIPFSAYGSDEYKFKGMIVGDKVITVAERDKIYAQWLVEQAAEYKKMNAKK
jgi:oligopeptide transport system substrate-binding protein